MGADEAPGARGPAPSIWVLITVTVLGTAATALAVAGESCRTQTYDVIQADGNGGRRCVCPPGAASMLASFALILVLTACVVAYWAASPSSFSELPPLKPGPALKWDLATNLLTMTFLAAAMTFFIIAMKVENEHDSESPGGASGTVLDVKCTGVSSGVFVAGAACSLLSFLLANTFYICAKRATGELPLIDEKRLGSAVSDGQALAVDMEELPMKLGRGF